MATRKTTRKAPTRKTPARKASTPAAPDPVRVLVDGAQRPTPLNHDQTFYGAILTELRAIRIMLEERRGL